MPHSSPADRTQSNLSGSDALKQVGKYRIDRKIGAGGMGAVYLAFDTQLKRNVALKLLPQDKAQNTTLVRRFHAEAHAAAALRHDNIVTVFEAGEADGYNFIALEFIDGNDVADLVQKRGVLPVKRSVEIVKQVARALQHASEQGIVHRDIKPANLLVRRDGVVKLADLGLARSLDDNADTTITRAGTTVGTVDYMSPEQARDSKAADVRSDIYSLGCTWYHMLTGGPPFPDGSLTNKLRAHAETPPADPRIKNPNVPESLVAVLNRMLAKLPRDRYQTADELVKDLHQAQLSRDAVSESVLSELAREESGTPRRSDEGVEGDEDDDGPFSSDESAPRKKKVAKGGKAAAEADEPDAPRRKPKMPNADEPVPEAGEPKKERSNVALFYASAVLLFIGAIAGVGWVVKSLGSGFDAPVEKAANPFATAPSTDGVPFRSDAPVASTEEGAGDGEMASTEEEPETKSTETKTTETAEASPAQPGPESTPGVIPTKAPLTIEKKDPAVPAWVLAGHSTVGLPLLTVRSDAPAQGSSADRHYTTLNAALDAVPAEGALIRIEGHGPFVLYSARLENRTRVVIQAAVPEIRPLVVVLPRPKNQGPLVLDVAGTTLELQDLDFALDATEFKEASVPDALVKVAAGDLQVRHCSFSMKGDVPADRVALRVEGVAPRPGGESHILVEDTLFRGKSQTALLADVAHADIVVRNNLIWSGTAPALRLEGVAASKPSFVRKLRVSSTTLCAQRSAVQLGGDGDKPIPTEILIQNSILGAPISSSNSESQAPTLLTLSGWTRVQARGALGNILTWKSPRTTLLGWKRLMMTMPEAFVVAEKPDEWRSRWKARESGEDSQFITAAWPAETGDDMTRLRLSEFSPETIGGEVAKTDDGAWPGCRLDRISLANIDALKKVAELAVRPKFPAGLTQEGAPAKTIRVDLTKEDLGKVLSSQQIPSGTLVIASGFGMRNSSPLIIQDKWIRIRFEQTEGYPLVLSPRLIEQGRGGTNKVDESFIVVKHGGLELIHGAFSIPTLEKQPIPKWFMQVIDGDFALRECRVQAPLVSSRNKGLIQWVRSDLGRPERPFPAELEGYGAMIDSYFIGSGTLFEFDLRQRACLVRNSIAASRDELFSINLQGSDPQIDGRLALEQSTLSAGTTFLNVKTSDVGGPTPFPFACFVERCVFGPPLAPRTGAQKGQVTLLAYQGPLLEQNQLAWWENSNGYAIDVKCFLRRADEDPAGLARTFDSAWLSQWTSERILRPLTEPAAVLLDHEFPDRSKLEPVDFKLHRQSKAATWSDGKLPIGAILSAMHLPDFTKKGTPAAVGKTKLPPRSNPAPPVTGF